MERIDETEAINTDDHTSATDIDYVGEEINSNVEFSLSPSASCATTDTNSVIMLTGAAKKIAEEKRKTLRQLVYILW